MFSGSPSELQSTATSCRNDDYFQLCFTITNSTRATCNRLSKNLCENTHIDTHDHDRFQRISNTKTICSLHNKRHRTLCEALSEDKPEPVFESEDTYDTACGYSGKLGTFFFFTISILFTPQSCVFIFIRIHAVTFTVFPFENERQKEVPMYLGSEIHVKKLPYKFQFGIVCDTFISYSIKMYVMPPLNWFIVNSDKFHRVRCNKSTITKVTAIITTEVNQRRSFKSWFEIDITKHITTGRIYGFFVFINKFIFRHIIKLRNQIIVYYFRTSCPSHI